MRSSHVLAAGLTALLAFGAASRASASFTMEQVLHYPYADQLAAAEHGDRIAWVRNLAGVRNVWVADGPAFQPRQVTHNAEDDGQEITQLTFSPDGTRLVYVRGGDHDANWPAEANLQPDPTSSPEQPQVTIWAVPAKGGAPVKVTEGDAPAISAQGTLAYIKDDQVWTAPLNGKGKPERLFFDRGKDRDLHWSPDGRSLAFMSTRGDHAFIGVFVSKDKPILYLAPSTSLDSSPRWSPDGASIAFVRRPGKGGAPEPLLKQVPQPWSIWVADAKSGAGHVVWQSPNTLEGSYPDTEGEANLHWADGGRLVFMADLDNWPHLYSMPVSGGQPVLLTPGAYMVEHVAESRDGRFMIFDANTGKTSGDFDRRHLFRVPVDRAGVVALTVGTTIEWMPAVASDTRVAFVSTGVQQPPLIGTVGIDGNARTLLDANAVPADFPQAQLITPVPVTFKAADGTTVHGQLFRGPGGGAAKPGLIFVHGGPPRQMLLGWHYMFYYSQTYAFNQYLASEGYVVLSINYRGGIGYGEAFREAPGLGATGASEFNDVLGAANFLRGRPDVDPSRIGVWGGSYGGYLTALALARASDLFAAGVDLHGVHDWNLEITKTAPARDAEKRKAEERVAFESSPMSSMATWHSPVLLIQGDDDRTVAFAQMVQLVEALRRQGVPFEQIVFPDEVHDFLLEADWLRAFHAADEFLARHLKP